MRELLTLINIIQSSTSRFQNFNSMNNNGMSSSTIERLENGLELLKNVDIEKIVERNRESIGKLVFIRNELSKFLFHVRKSLERFVGQVLTVVTAIQNVVNTINSILITLGLKKRSLLQKILGY